MRKLLFWLIKTKFWRWLLLHSPIPYIRLTTYYPSLKGRQYRNCLKVIREGDIILCRDNKKLTTKLIGGEFTHAMYFRGHDKKYQCVDMTHENYRKCDLFDAFKESDRVAIQRVPMSQNERSRLTNAIDSFDGAIYDVAFGLGAAFIYCS